MSYQVKQLSKETLIENHKKNMIDLLISFAICAVGIIGSGWFLASERNNMIFWLLISLLLIVYLIFKTQKYFRLLQKLKQDQFIILQKGYFEKKKELTGQSHPSYNHYLYFDCGKYGILSYFVNKKMYQNIQQSHMFYLVIVPTMRSKYELIQLYDAHQWDATALIHQCSELK